MKDFKSGKRPAKPGAPKGRSFGGEKRSFSGEKRSFSGENRSFGGDKPRFGGNSAPTGMFSAICATCGNHCEVPFKPNGLKQVFCNSCFNAGGSKPLRQAGGKPAYNSPREFGNTHSGPSSYSKSQLDHIEAKLDKILALLSDDE